MNANDGNVQTYTIYRPGAQLTQQFTFGEIGNSKEEFDFWRSENFFNQPSNLAESMVSNSQPVVSDNWFTSIYTQPIASDVAEVQEPSSPTFEQKTSRSQPIVRSVRRIRLDDRSICSPTNSQKGEYFTFSENRLDSKIVSSAVISTPQKDMQFDDFEDHIFLPGNTMSSIKIFNFESRQELDFDAVAPEPVEELPITSVQFPLFPNLKMTEGHKRFKASTVLSAMIDIKKSVSKYRNKLEIFLNLKNPSEFHRADTRSSKNNSMAQLAMKTKPQTAELDLRENLLTCQELETPAFVSKVLVESKFLLEKSTNIVESVIASKRYDELAKRKGTRLKQENAPRLETSKLINAYLPLGFLTSVSK